MTDKPEFLEGVIDISRVRADYERLTTDIAGIEHKLESMQTDLTEKRQRRERLSDFLTLADEYKLPIGRVEPPSAPLTPEPESAAAPPPTPPAAAAAAHQPAKTKRKAPEVRYLRRTTEGTQTKVANILIAGFKPNEVFDLETAVESLKQFIPAHISVSPGHWIGGYLTREFVHTNGILVKVSPQNYRVKENAESILQSGFSTSKGARTGETQH